MNNIVQDQINQAIKRVCDRMAAKDAEILRLREDNRKLLEAVISERVARFKQFYSRDDRSQERKS